MVEKKFKYYNRSGPIPALGDNLSYFDNRDSKFCLFIYLF